MSQVKIRTALISAVFITFVANGTGLMDLHLQAGSGIAFRSNSLLQMILSGRLPPALDSIQFLTFFLTGILLSVALPRCPPIRASMVTALCMLVTIYIHYAFPARATLIPMEYALLTILILFALNVLVSWFAESHENERLLSIFGQYVPPEVASSIAKAPQNFNLEGESRDLSVMFCDIHGFTQISETLEPRQLASMLNEYFTLMTDILQQHGATIDKYIGDAIMAFWGAPIPQPDHTARAVLAAMDMQDAVVGLRDTFEERGWPQLASGIGINTGLMNVGNMGSKFRIAYTVVGDAVNLGARIEQLTRVYGLSTLVSEATMTAVPGILFREIDHVRVKGKGKSTRIFEPVGLAVRASDEEHQQLAKHKEALNCYYQGDWARASQLFSELAGIAANPLYYQVLGARVGRLQADPPAHWDGVTHLNAV